MSRYDDPPAPRPRQPGEPPPEGMVFNPEYDLLVGLWHKVIPPLDELSSLLDKPYNQARDPATWSAPSAARHIADLREMRNRLLSYRRSVLTEISERAESIPRWVAPGQVRGA